MRRPSRSRASNAAILLGALSAVACDRRPPAADASSAAPQTTGSPVVLTVRDDDIATSVAVAPTAISVGQGIGVALSAEAPDGVTIALPAPEALAPFEPLRSSEERRRIDPATGAVKLERRWVVTAWEGGDLVIPALTTTFTASDGTSRTLSLPEVPVVVESLVEEPFDPARFADIHGLPAAPAPASRWPWAVAGVVVLAIGAAAWILLRRRLAPPPPPGPEAWALGELDALASEGLPARGLVEPYFVRLVEVVRGYLQRRLAVDAPGLTSEEFLRAAVGDRRFGAAQREPLERLLRFSDLIKFARAAATPEQCAAAMEAVRGLVAALRPTEPPAP